MSSTKDIVIIRIFDAPKATVWKAWTVPEQVMKWWGPKGMTSPECTIDLQVGGKYVFCMQAEDGQKFYSGGIYKEIVPEEKIVMTDSFTDKDGNQVSPETYGMPADFPQELTITLEFEDQNGKTKMTVTHEGMPEGEMRSQTEGGWNESLDKLTEAL